MISALTVTEVTAAMWGKVRQGEMGPELASILEQEFCADVVDGRFAVVAITPSITARSLEAVRRHRLRGADAIQLATAIEARAADASLSTIAVYDARLRDAAVAEGFALLPSVRR